MWNHRAWLSVMLVLGGLLAAAPANGREPTKWALLIGVDDYVEVNDLRYAGNDQRALAEKLKTVGFPADQIFLMHDRADERKYLPFRNNIEKQLDLVLELPEPGDTIVVAFSGHGVHLNGASYLCAADARLDAPAETMVKMATVYERLEACPANIKLLLVDACRNDPRPDGERSLTATRGTREFARSLDESLPKGILQFTSCKEGQVSIEEPGFQHGVFIHFLLEGLQGHAADDEGVIRLARLVDYVQSETKKHVARKHNVAQSPALKGEMDGPIELCRIERAAKMTVEPPVTKPVVPLPTPSSPSQSPTPPSANMMRPFSNSIGMKLAPIPTGEFMMGSGESDGVAEPNEKPAHRVRITRPFYFGVHEVTRGQFARFVAATNYETDAEKAKGSPQGDVLDINYECGMGLTTPLDRKSKFVRAPQFNWKKWGVAQTDAHPVVNVSWNDAVAFCVWLSQEDRRSYRLPTEAEWEYACRAGTSTRFYNGDDPARLIAIANVRDVTAKEKLPAEFSGLKANLHFLNARDGFAFPSPVGTFQPNAFGLYDMIGNAAEICLHWYDDDYYATSRIDDPAGYMLLQISAIELFNRQNSFDSSTSDDAVASASGFFSRVVRGGSFNGFEDCRPAARRSQFPKECSNSTGFRVVCEQ